MGASRIFKYFIINKPFQIYFRFICNRLLYFICGISFADFNSFLENRIYGFSHAVKSKIVGVTAVNCAGAAVVALRVVAEQCLTVDELHTFVAFTLGIAVSFKNYVAAICIFLRLGVEVAL